MRDMIINNRMYLCKVREDPNIDGRTTSQDLGQMKIKNWLSCVQERAKWKDVVEKAKTSN